MLFLIFGIPIAIRSDSESEFLAVVVQHLRRWLGVKVDTGPVNYPREQSALERAGACLQDTLSELCRASAHCWYEHVAPVCWIKQILPDPTLPAVATPFRILLGRKPRTTREALKLETDTGSDVGGMDTFVEKQRSCVQRDQSNPLRAPPTTASG